jgi:hypothetical protein
MKAIALSICSVLLLAVGCSKEESSTPTPPPKAPAAEASKATTQQAVDAAKAAGEKAVAEASSKADEMIKQAKGLVDAKKYSDASNVLQQVATLKLTPEQQKLVDDLKTAIKNAMAKEATTEGTKAVGDLLGGKK